MARLETQIHQIFLQHPKTTKNSLILYEEQLTPSLQLFVVACLQSMQKKSENTDLKKISEIILGSFNANKKLPAETLFESSLSTINQNLADLAHAGRKSWVGKFSCLICVRGADNNIYLSNTGQTAAWLRRKSELLEILSAEKSGMHPLKMFTNFTQGKLTDGDYLVLTTSNIFNYISFELFAKLLGQNASEKSVTEITKILQDSMSEDQAFASFIMQFAKKSAEEQEMIATPAVSTYAPAPEEIEMDEPSSRRWMPKLPALPAFNLKLPKINLERFRIRWTFFQNLSTAGKFFFISFAVFLLLFLINLGVYQSKSRTKQNQSRADQLVAAINDDIGQTQSSLIYKDENQSLTSLAKTLADFEELTKLDKSKADQLAAKIEQIKAEVNKINTVENPSLLTELKHHPLYLSHATIGYLFANQDSNSLSLLDSSNKLTDYFLLNSLKNPINSIAYFQPAGVVVSSTDQIYRIDQNLKQFEPLVATNLTNIRQIKYYNNFLYVLTDTKIAKISFTKGKYQVQTSANGDFSQARDFGIDKDIYVLFADKVIKYVAGNPQAFAMPNMSDQLSNGNKLFDASNLYILESNKKRIVIVNKNGALINQIYFPTTSEPTDFYIDEPSRSIYLLDDNKFYKITF